MHYAKWIDGLLDVSEEPKDGYKPLTFTDPPGSPGQGDTPDNPIPYTGNMALVKDKYYSQSSVTYLCIRDTINPIYVDLKDLIGIYVEIVL